MVRPDIFDDRESEYVTGTYKSKVRHFEAPHRTRDDGYGYRHTTYLGPEYGGYSSGLHRTKSTGHAPNPNITIVNTTEANPNLHAENRSPVPSPGLYPQDRGRSRRMPGEWDVDDELAELRYQRSRSRSDLHGHHHGSHSPGHDYDRWQLEAANQRIKEAEERRKLEKEEELIKRRYDNKYMKEKFERDQEEARKHEEEERIRREMEWKFDREARKRMDLERERSEERKRIIAEEKAKMEKEERQREQRAREKKEEERRIIMEAKAKLDKTEREEKEARQRAVDEFNKEQAEEKRKRMEEQARIVAEYEAKKSSDEAKAKRQREELLMQIRIEEEAQKRKEKEEYERFLLLQQRKQQEEKEKKEKKEAELEEEMRKRLAQFGFQDNQIKAMVRPEEAAKLRQGMAPGNPLRLGGHQPTYVKVHKEHLAIDTLQYYDIPYEVDRANPDYIIIMREMEPRETEILFEHTRRLRSRGTSRLLIEERHDSSGKNDYAWVRRRKPSRSPSRSRRGSPPKRNVGIKEMFF